MTSSSSSADVYSNGNSDAAHEHILRPRAVKPGNPAVLRALSEEGFLAAKNGLQNGDPSGQTRQVSLHNHVQIDG